MRPVEPARRRVPLAAALSRQCIQRTLASETPRQWHPAPGARDARNSTSRVAGIGIILLPPLAQYTSTVELSNRVQFILLGNFAMPVITRFLSPLIFLTAWFGIAHGGEIVIVKAKIEKIDPTDRKIIVSIPDSDEKFDLEFTRKTKIKRGEEAVGPDSIKAGDSATIKYDSELLVALSIEIGATVPTEALNLEELNGPEMDIAPWVSSDGLEIFWPSGPDKEFSIWSARRKNPDGFFEGKKRLFAGHAPVLSADGLEMYFRNADAETISLATRKQRDDDFGRPRPVPSLAFPGLDAAPRWLTQDGRSLYLDLRAENGKHHCWEVKRATLKSNWTKPNKTEAKFEGMPANFRFTQVSATPDNRTLYCTTEFSNQSNQRVYRTGILSRKEPTGPFTQWTELPLTGPNGQYPLCLKPQFVSATHELFLTSNAFYSDPQGVMKRRFDLWVIKDFQPPIETSEK